MGNKLGRLGFFKRSKKSKKDRQPLLNPDNTEVETPTGNSEESTIEQDFPTETLRDLWDDDYSMAEYLAELSDLDESPVETMEVELSDGSPAENNEPENVTESSVTVTDVVEKPKNVTKSTVTAMNMLEELLTAMLDPVENIPLETLRETLTNEERKSLDFLMQVSKEVNNVSVPNSALKNLMELLVNGECTPLENPESSRGFQNITAESLFSLSVYSLDCYLPSVGVNNPNGNLEFGEYVAPLLEEGISCLNITRYNSERKRVLDITLVCKEITSGVAKFILYLWDSKQDKWRLITSPYVEMDPNKCFAPPDVRAKGIYYTNQKATSCRCKSLSQSTPSADLPLHIKKSLESETRLTAYDGYLEKKMDVTLAQGKKQEHETEFYIEWMTTKKVAYCFTVPNEVEPTGQ